MAATGGFVRTIKNGSLAIKDGGTANNSITMTFEGGELTGDLKQKDFQPVLSRGTIQQFIEGDEQPLTGSLTCHLTTFLGSGSYTNFDDLTQFMALLQNTAADGVTTSTGLAGEPTTLTIELTISDPDASGSEVLAWAKCVIPSITLNEGYPSRYTFNWVSRGGLTIT